MMSRTDNQDDNDLLECKVCFNKFTDNLRPRSLSCGHTFCTSCINQALKNESPCCPKCRFKLTATSATEFPINYMAEAFLKSLREVSTSTTTTTTRTEDSVSTKGIGGKLESLRGEQVTIVRTLSKLCYQSRSQLDEYEKHIIKWKDDLNKITQFEIIMNTALENLEEEHQRLREMRKEGRGDERQLEAALGILTRANSAQEVGFAIDEAEICGAAAQDWNNKCQERFPNVSTVRNTLMVKETFKGFLEIMKSKARCATPGPLADSASTIKEKVDFITRNTQHINITPWAFRHLQNTLLTVDTLRTRTEHLKKLLLDGQVAAVHESGGIRSAKISLMEEKMFLHYLQDKPLSPDHNTVMKVLDPESTVVFLDLAWPNSKGRVYIRLYPTDCCQRAQHFLALCTGQRGPSYVNTRFLVVERGSFWERVVTGDYEHNNGKGGAAVHPEVGMTKYEGLYSRGTVAGLWWGSDDTAAQFIIYTRVTSEDSHPLMFGEVVSGLEVVQSTVKLSDITNVTVVDCGVVLPF
ncbi:Peptidyl-prolyl cis-trans isomerase cyp11-like [Homarus americanus]|uniref:Peptidyl-prolyl cis-trans isomerase cyp11-like n=1 Tax=Homarus americanus TaxID=6706 RepID=A0A8J5MQ13_HOMAM|nr:Peptidyl-prolyl cis-trans isomerase cyp11-like [Homarus americanus]